MCKQYRTRTKLRYCEAIGTKPARFDSDLKNKVQYILCILRSMIRKTTEELVPIVLVQKELVIIVLVLNELVPIVLIPKELVPIVLEH